MKVVSRVTFVDEQGEKFFGEGPARLLHAVEETGSLRAAAMSMNMAYTKALKLIRNAEQALGYPVMTRVTGGRDGGGSRLTEEGKCWLKKYETYRDACAEANRKIYQEMFPEEVEMPKTCCVIMASGLGRRFGGNKLTADFLGKPLITWILKATEEFFDRRIVVTRHETVASICREQAVEVILHDLPGKNDTIRLGIEAGEEADLCVFCPADQPLLHRETVQALLERAKEQPDKIWRVCCEGTPGAPVLFPRWAYYELKTLPEDCGGSWLIRKYPERVALLPVESPYELMDADTPQALEALREYANKT